MEESLVKFLSKLELVNENDILEAPENEQVLELAFVGDTVFDFFTRDLLVRHFKDKIKMNDLHKKNSNLVCAKSQARIVEYLIDNNYLAEDEISYYKHARNAHPHSKSKNSSIVDYRKATGFESLLGVIYYKKSYDRLVEIFSIISKYIKDNNLI